MAADVELQGLREENQTLYGVIKLVSSSLELSSMLQGVVDQWLTAAAASSDTSLSS